jgi:hypothetical protein
MLCGGLFGSVYTIRLAMLELEAIHQQQNNLLQLPIQKCLLVLLLLMPLLLLQAWCNALRC